MKEAPWENGLVYIRMSFAFVYLIDGHRIVESIPLLRTIAQPPSSATWSYFSLILCLIEFRNIRYSNRPRKIRYSNQPRKLPSLGVFAVDSSTDRHVYSNRAASLSHLLVLYDIFYLPKFREQRYSNRPKMVNSA